LSIKSFICESIEFEYVATNRYNGAYVIGVYDTTGGLGIVSYVKELNFLIYSAFDCVGCGLLVL
jgi:hypothetical protein